MKILRPSPLRLLLVASLAFMAGLSTYAQDAAPAASAVAAAVAAVPTPKMSDHAALRVGLDTVWVLVAAMLVFFMNAGFALVESGLCRAKNCVNILSKNFVVFALSTISFWVIGWGLMFGDGNSFMGLKGLFFLGGADNSPALGEAYMAMNPFSVDKYAGDYGAINWTPVPLWAKFFFQLVFAGTAATIVSGAVAERIKFGAFMIFSLLLVAFVYPITGHWIWGGGLLAADNFRDFAGSTVVHSVGGWAALAGVIVLGPRLGKFGKDGKVHPIPGHNMTSAALGVLILWLGWFGFNPGSTMSAGDGKAIAHVLVNTNIAAATGTLAALITAWVLLKKPDLSMILNGCLAGLVAITAPCAFVSLTSGAIIGAIAGVLAVLAVIFFDKMKLDDPVGALAVHLVNGVFGTLALGLFYNYDIASSIAALPPVDAAGKTIPAEQWGVMAQTMVQLKGVAYVGVFVFAISLVLWYALKVIIGIRVSPEEEIEGLDKGEHGNEAYPDFTTAHHN
ncbi:MAG: ammonium transporter [Opitutaceae bacterium]